GSVLAAVAVVAAVPAAAYAASAIAAVAGAVVAAEGGGGGGLVTVLGRAPGARPAPAGRRPQGAARAQALGARGARAPPPRGAEAGGGGGGAGGGGGGGETTGQWAMMWPRSWPPAVTRMRSWRGLVRRARLVIRPASSVR